MTHKHQAPLQFDTPALFIEAAQNLFRSNSYARLCMGLGNAMDAKSVLIICQLCNRFRPKWLKYLRNRDNLTMEQKYEILDLVNERFANVHVYSTQPS